MVVVSAETNLVDVKGLCSIDVGYGNCHKLKFPVHPCNLSLVIGQMAMPRCPLTHGRWGGSAHRGVWITRNDGLPPLARRVKLRMRDNVPYKWRIRPRRTDGQ